MILTLTIPDETAATGLLEAFCAATKYDPASGIKKEDWTKKFLIEYLRLMSKRGDLQLAQKSIGDKVDAVVIA